MIRWLLRQWHRFTLGLTARIVSVPFATTCAPLGTGARLVAEIGEVAERCVPAGIYVEICARRATDLNQPGTIRIVIETMDGWL